jgi:hypothetical protein
VTSPNPIFPSRRCPQICPTYAPQVLVHHRCRCSPGADRAARPPLLVGAAPASSARRGQSRRRPSQPPPCGSSTDGPRSCSPPATRNRSMSASLPLDQRRRGRLPRATAVAANEDGGSTTGKRQGRHRHYVLLCRGAGHYTILEMVGPC